MLKVGYTKSRKGLKRKPIKQEHIKSRGKSTVRKACSKGRE